MKRATLGLALILTAFGCSKPEAMINLGAIELHPNTPKHLNIAGMDWILTETMSAQGKLIITAESTQTVTQGELSSASVPPGMKVGSILKNKLDLSNAPTGVEIIGYFGKTLTRYILKADPQ